MKILRKCICFIPAVLLVLSMSFVSAEEQSFTSKKSTARVSQAGDIVECIITSSEVNLYSYRSQLVYDADLLEFESVTPVYIPGDGELIKYYGVVPESPMNVPGSLVYKKDGAETGFYAEDSIPGMYRNISTRLGYEARPDSDVVLSIRLKAKKAGTCFIYLMDEQTAVINDDKSVTNDVIETELTVISGGEAIGSVAITDSKEIAYPWRESDAVFQEIKAEDTDGNEVFEGEYYDVSYINREVDIKVKDDGTIICNIRLGREENYPPMVARISATGGFEKIKRVKYDAASRVLSFVVDNFGDYIVTDSKYDILDCYDDSAAYNAVCYLKSIGVIDENSLSFEPNRSITRAEFIKMLVCCVGEVDTGALSWFSDVDISDWYYKYIATAIKLGIIDDNGEIFEPDAPLRLTDAREMLQRASEIINGSGEVAVNTSDILSRRDAAVAIQNMFWLNLN